MDGAIMAGMVVTIMLVTTATVVDTDIAAATDTVADIAHRMVAAHMDMLADALVVDTAAVDMPVDTAVVDTLVDTAAADMPVVVVDTLAVAADMVAADTGKSQIEFKLNSTE
jgi:hypothetical protein